MSALTRRIMKLIILFFMILPFISYGAKEVVLSAPEKVPLYGVGEFTFRLADPVKSNLFTDVMITGKFSAGSVSKSVEGFCDSKDGTVYRLRFSPEIRNASYRYEIVLKGKDFEKKFTGRLKTTPPLDQGPVITDPEYPRHFIYAGTKKPFIHLGCTEYHLVDIANSDAQVDSTILYCQRNGFNKIRFLLAGYPRDFDSRTSTDTEHGVPVDPRRAVNYGSLPGRVNPLPAWEGQPHRYDFTRFNVSYWQRVDRAVSLMKSKGIVATCILIIEKQDLPKEIGRLTENEYRLYRYAIARLAAFDNVWWDLGNEHNEYRDSVWGNTMGAYVKSIDPYHRLASAHAYADFFYSRADWADFIITQQYGPVDSVHHWVLKYDHVRKPYVNEEYGYEGSLDKPVGHGMNAGWVRKCHWAIALAGGYGTYGDWSNSISYFYMGIPGPGIAAGQLKYLRFLLETVPFCQMVPSDSLISRGYCLSKPGTCWLVYLPEGGPAELNLSAAKNSGLSGKWYDPVTGIWSESTKLVKGKNLIEAPPGKDLVFVATCGRLK